MKVKLTRTLNFRTEQVNLLKKLPKMLDIIHGGITLTVLFFQRVRRVCLMLLMIEKITSCGKKKRRRS